MVTARWLIADVFDGLATIPDGSVDLVVTSPPFLALRSYLPADHPNKSREIGSEATPAEFIDTMLRVTAELSRVLAPHGSLCVELGDTYAGSGGAGGDYSGNGWRDGQERFGGSGRLARYSDQRGNPDGMRDTTFSGANTRSGGGSGWPLAKSKSMIPELYRVALAYGINPLTGEESPAGRWRVRNVVTWVRPNPPVGALGDKWRPATSDILVACTSERRYWDDLATRRENGAPLLDWWEIPPGGYTGSHYAVFPEALVEPLVKAMAPPRVCVACGEPSRRIVETVNAVGFGVYQSPGRDGDSYNPERDINRHAPDSAEKVTLGWTSCGHDRWRPAHILDPFAGSGTTGVVATGHGHDVTLIDLDERNRELARERIGPILFEEVQLRKETP